MASVLGLFAQNTIPPKIILTCTIPLLLFYILYVQKANWFKEIFAQITIDQLVKIHIFRFIGVFFFLVYSYDALPKAFAFIGGTGDILAATLAIPLIYIIKKKNKYAVTLTWIWNIIGLIDIVAVITTAIITTRFAIENNIAGVVQFGTFPFSWVPAFAPATILFFHILVFKKLREVKKG
jgi:hypothetical protein